MVRAKFKKYKQLDGSELEQIEKIGAGNVIRRFDKTPYPIKPTDVVCPHFMEIAWSWGCPYNCAYCYLKGTYRFFQKNGIGRVPMHFKKKGIAEKELTAFLALDIPAEILNAGELSDGLMAEGTTEWGEPFSKWVMRFVYGTKHKVLFLSKGTNIQNFLENEWQKNAILSWTINAKAVAKRWEHLAPSPIDRLEAAKKAADAGYEVRLRLDPMVAVENWQEDYADIIDEIFKRLIPERITLGTLRGLSSTIAHAADKSWVKYLDEKSSWGRKPSFKRRLALYNFITDYLNSYGFSKVGLCKDTLAMWKALGKDFSKITCNCVW